ncbi:MAG TPA: DUF4336 domain-containing protein [Myxococcota bacterium]|nr:DUF4336 domain-containing protein [Myxococcota bacterium]
MTALERLDEGLFVAAGPERVAHLNIGTRMTVLRLADGRLFLHSPVPHTPELDAALAGIGEVAWIVAPSKVHHLWLGSWADAHPEATLVGAPGLREKRRDLVFHRELADTPPSDWADEIDQCLVAGMPYVNEVAFLHRASRTLLLTDLAMNFSGPLHGVATRLWRRAMGLGDGLGTSRLVHLLVRDRDALRPALERVLAWDFERVIVTHGDVLEHGGAEALRLAWAPLLEK